MREIRRDSLIQNKTKRKRVSGDSECKKNPEDVPPAQPRGGVDPARIYRHGTTPES
jgi:hypothetical protein